MSRGTSPQRAPDDLALCVVAAQQGDEAAFDTLYVTVQPGLPRYLHGLVGGDAEDVASQTWPQIVRDLPALRDASGFRGWAATIAWPPGSPRTATVPACHP